MEEKTVVQQKITLKQKMSRLHHKIFDVKNDTMPKSLSKGKNFFVFCMVIIGILHFAVFYVGVNYKAIVLGFQKEVEGTTVFTFDWFIAFFKEFSYEDSVLMTCFKNTLKYFVLNSFFLFITGYLISYFLYKKILGYKIFRVVFYMFGIISGIVVVALFKSIIAVEGPIYTIVKEITGTELPFLLKDDSTATNTIMIYCVWTGLASNFILLTGAMNRIPEELIEAAKLEGCGWFREMTGIVTPLIWDTVGTLFILSFIGIFQASGPILLFQTPESTYTFSYWIYLQVTAGSNNYPAAIGLFVTVITLPIVFLVRHLLSKIETVEF